MLSNQLEVISTEIQFVFCSTILYLLKFWGKKHKIYRYIFLMFVCIYRSQRTEQVAYASKHHYTEEEKLPILKRKMFYIVEIF